MTSGQLLEVEDLSVSFGGLKAVEKLTFAVRVGETVGIIGESGCGKSVSVLALLNLLPSYATVEGRARLRGVDLLSANREALHNIRGRVISMTFQDPSASLNPVKQIGSQIAEGIRLHEGFSRGESWKRAVELLEQVGIPNPSKRVKYYPHELSGGQRQRAMIAMALACNPELLIADEPTTALDTTVQARVLDLIADLVSERNIALLLISHDLGVIARMCKRTIVMYGGRKVEEGETRVLLRNPAHPYTHGLLGSRPTGTSDSTDDRLPSIPGTVPSLGQFPSGCVFRDRCPRASSQCTQVPTLSANNGHVYACWHPLSTGRDIGSTVPSCEGQRRETKSEFLPIADEKEEDGYGRIEVKGLTKIYQARRHSPLSSREPATPALSNVSFDLTPGETLGIVGESGSGKTTLIRVLSGLERPTEGSVRIDGYEPPHRLLRRRCQLIFQDPFNSLDPRMRIGEIIAEPELATSDVTPEKHRLRDRVLALLREVGLPERSIDKYPHELSGGQRQRVAIARALIAEPSVLLADEPVSSLDLSVQANILNLLRDIQRSRRVTTLFVSHDLTVVRWVAERVLVFHQGRVVESGSVHEVLNSPREPYTRSLIEASLTIDGDSQHSSSSNRDVQ